MMGFVEFFFFFLVYFVFPSSESLPIELHMDIVCIRIVFSYILEWQLSNLFSQGSSLVLPVPLAWKVSICIISQGFFSFSKFQYSFPILCIVLLLSFFFPVLVSNQVLKYFGNLHCFKYQSSEYLLECYTLYDLPVTLSSI